MASAPKRTTGRERVATILLLAGMALVAAGYWGPWVWSPPPGLRILGLDLAEYVKFIAEVRSGQIAMVRESFYLPLVALSLSLSLLAHRAELRLPSASRWVLNLLAIPAALAMLPPAWSPPLLVTSEFSRQTVAIALCVLAAIVSRPLLRRLPGTVVALLVVALSTAGIVVPVASFNRLIPALDAIYGRPVDLGRGRWQTSLGLALVAIATVLAVTGSRHQRR